MDHAAVESTTETTQLDSVMTVDIGREAGDATLLAISPHVTGCLRGDG